MARTSTSSSRPAPAEISFEDAIANLEAIVEAMEHDHLPLEDLVAHYEQGSKLLDRCESILKSARNRIELITLRNQNEIPLESAPALGHVSGPSTDPSDSPADLDDEQDDIRLF